MSKLRRVFKIKFIFLVIANSPFIKGFSNNFVFHALRMVMAVLLVKDHRICSFRYIQLSRGWQEEEKRLYGLFTSTYGTPPKCNKVSPVGN